MRQSRKYIAITGGIGSGKSIVLDVAKELGYPVFSADGIAADIYRDDAVLLAVKKEFPSCVRDGQIVRAELAKEVFSDKSRLAVLDALTHPAIMKKLREAMDSAEGDAVFAEVPLLFEGGYERQFDRVIVVLRPLEDRIAALFTRNGLCREDALARIKNQFDYEKNRIIGHTVLYNDSDLATFKKRAEAAVREAAEGGA